MRENILIHTQLTRYSTSKVHAPPESTLLKITATAIIMRSINHVHMTMDWVLSRKWAFEAFLYFLYTQIKRFWHHKHCVKVLRVQHSDIAVLLFRWTKNKSFNEALPHPIAELFLPQYSQTSNQVWGILWFWSQNKIQKYQKLEGRNW